jgi:acyl carrier protein
MPKRNQDTSAIINQLTPIFRDVLDNDDLVITSATKAADVDGWDSLAHIHLVVSIEKALKMRFTAEEVSSLENVGDLAALILKKQTNG